MTSFSLPPVVESSSKVLVLGTMPGPLSLAKGEYYAHPRNVYWRIASDLFHFDPALPSTSPANAAIGYEQKLLQWRAIAAHG